MIIVTHDGHFHADEVLAVVILQEVYPQSQVRRSRELGVLSSADVVVDVGQQFDPVNRRYDHHQRSFKMNRKNGLPYSSAGLIWQYFWPQLVADQETASLIEDALLIPVDAKDNGFELVDHVAELGVVDISSVVSSFNRDDCDENVQFHKARTFVSAILSNVIYRAEKYVADQTYVRDMVRRARNQRILVIEKSNWFKQVIPTDILYVVYPDAQDDWRVQAVPPSIQERFKQKRPLPESWAGESATKLRDLTGIPDVVFCHVGRWICGARSKQSAIRLAELALED